MADHTVPPFGLLGGASMSCLWIQRASLRWVVDLGGQTYPGGKGATFFLRKQMCPLSTMRATENEWALNLEKVSKRNCTQDLFKNSLTDFIPTTAVGDRGFSIEMS